MRAFLLWGLLMTLPLAAAPGGATSLPKGPDIRVLLEKDINSATLEVKGGYRVVRKDSGSTLSSGRSGKQYVVHALQNGLRWGEEYPDVFQISIVPTKPDTRVFVNGIEYMGQLSVYHVRNKITIVNEVPLEEFVKSKLALECDSPLSREAMRALAISVRTEAYKCVIAGKSSRRPWEIVAAEAGYYGCAVGDRTHGVEEAVDWTRFMVLEGSGKSYLLSHTEAESLASEGFDAKKILLKAFPGKKMGITIDANEVAIK